MDEFTIATAPKGVKRVDSGLWKYPIILEDQQTPNGANWDLNEFAKDEGMWLYNGKIRDAMRIEAPDQCALLAPSYFDITLEQVRRGVKTDGWSQKMTKHRDDYQLTFYNDSRFAGHGVVRIMSGVIHVESSLMETLAYNYIPIEKKDCNHQFVYRWFEGIQQGLHDIYQPDMYIIKPTMKLMVANRVKWKVRESVNPNGDSAKGEGGLEVIERKSGETPTEWSPTKAEDNNLLYSREIRLGVSGNVAKARTHLSVGKHFNNLKGLADKWNQNREDVPVGKICWNLSEIAKIYTDGIGIGNECKKVKEKFASELRKHLVGQTNESNAIRAKGRDNEVAFAALILIAAGDAIEGKITWDTKHGCLRGALLYAETLMGDAYFFMRKFLDWSVRPGHHKNIKIEEKRQYIFRKTNAFESSVKEGMQPTIWSNTYLPMKRAHVNTGNVCHKAYHEEGDDVDFVHWYDETLYSKTIGELIDGNKSITDVRYEDLFDWKGDILSMNFELDAYLDDDGDIFYPYYMEKRIYSPILRTIFWCRKTVVDTQVKEDIWHKRITSEFLDDSESFYKHVVRSKVSSLCGIDGKTVVVHQEGTEYFKHLREKYSERCTIQAASCSMHISIWKRIFSILKFHASGERLSHHMIDTYDPDAIDCWGAENQIEKCVTWSQFIGFTLNFIWENNTMVPDTDEAKAAVESIIEGNVLSSMKRWPRAYSTLVMNEKSMTVGDTLLFNIIQLIKYCHRSTVKHGKYCYLLLYSDEVKLLVIPEKHVSISMLLAVMSYHPGAIARTRKLNGAEQTIVKELRNHVISTQVSWISDGLRTFDSRTQQFNIYCGSLCNGISETVIMIRPLIFPQPSVLAVVFHDRLVSSDVAIKEAKKIYKYTMNNVIGYVAVQIVDETNISVKTFGPLKQKTVRRAYMLMDHYVCIVKTCGHVLGNEELVSKLMNRK
nr:VP2 [Tibet orbivirus]